MRATRHTPGDGVRGNHGESPHAPGCEAAHDALVASLAPPPTAPLRESSPRTGLRAAASRKAAGLADSLLNLAQPGGATDDALASSRLQLPKLSPRKAAVLGVVFAAAVVLFLVQGPGGELAAAFERAAAADWRWAGVAVVSEALAFAGFAATFWLVAGKQADGLGWRSSTEISLGAAAASRVLPTAGLGGIALMLWSLARRGVAPANAVRTLLTFLVLVYVVFMGALALSGLALVTGVAAGDGPVPLKLGPAAFGLVVIVLALSLARGDGLFAQAVRAAIGFARSADPRLLGALAWWIFDMGVLFAAFQALGGGPTIAVLVLAYFTGCIGNTIPLPGLVAGGTIGVLVAFGVDASAAIPAVLAYRAIALWLPAVLGTVALTSLRRSMRAADAAGAAEAAAEVAESDAAREERFEREPVPALCAA